MFAAFCMLAPLLVLGLAEITLRGLGYGGYQSIIREIGPTPQGTLVITEQAGPRGFFFANRERPGYNEQYSFYAPKPDDTVRVVLVGGSAIKGFPQTRVFAVSSFLQEMLSDCWPDRSVEVINLGTTAVASFPVTRFLNQVLDYEPDLVVVYTGHNEFYGAYGVASINRAGTSPGMLELQYRLRSLAMAEAAGRLIYSSRRHESKTLMEVMVGQDYVGPADSRRNAAADLLYHHVGSMIQSCRQREVPVMVCTLPSNERDLAPIGQDAPDQTMEAAVTEAMHAFEQRPEDVIQQLTPLLEGRPDHARAHFYLGKALFATGQYVSAHPHFIRARDLDPMPWRATSLSQEAIRRAADEQGASLCDVEAMFRRNSPGGAIGWELMDDHVHPSLQGQALLARSIVQTLTNRNDSLAVQPNAYASLPEWETYADRLGDNPYDRYAVAHTTRVLFDIPFMRASNPQARQRFRRMVGQAERSMPDDILPIARKWQTKQPHAGGKRPITGMVARGLLRKNDIERALPLFDVARRSVPVYSSWHLEYVYFWLVSCQLQHGALTADEQGLAMAEITRGRILLTHGYSESGFTERYMGRLHQLLGEFDEAVPLLESARKKLYGLDRVATEQALIVSYLQMGRPESAREIAEAGVQHSGQYADLYRNMLQGILSGGKSVPPPASTAPTGNASDP